MATTTDFAPVRPQLDTATLDRMVKTGLAMALATVIVAMLVVVVAGLNASATLVVLFFAAVLGGLAGGRLAWTRRL